MGLLLISLLYLERVLIPCFPSLCSVGSFIICYWLSGAIALLIHLLWILLSQSNILVWRGILLLRTIVSNIWLILNDRWTPSVYIMEEIPYLLGHQVKVCVISQLSLVVFKHEPLLKDLLVDGTRWIPLLISESNPFMNPWVTYNKGLNILGSTLSVDVVKVLSFVLTSIIYVHLANIFILLMRIFSHWGIVLALDDIIPVLFLQADRLWIPLVPLLLSITLLIGLCITKYRLLHTSQILLHLSVPLLLMLWPGWILPEIP